MSAIELKFLGVPEIRLDDRPVVLARRASIGLLAYLTLTKRAHPRETLATLLAGDTSEEHARKHLSNLLGDLRKHLGDCVQSTRQAVELNPEQRISVDVFDFQRLIGASAQDQSRATYGQATELYRDEFLAGIALDSAPDFDAWLLAQREELRQQYVASLRGVVEDNSRRGEWVAGIRAARKLIGAEPWLEEAHQQLMHMLAASGQRDAAMAQYFACRQVLREELDVEPQPETTALFERLRAVETPPPSNLLSQPDRIVGRREEQQSLTMLFSHTEHRLVSVVGLGGSGKTRLGLEVAHAFAHPGAAVCEQPFSDGVFFVSLEHHCDETLRPTAAATALVSAISEAVGLRPVTADRGLEQLLSHLCRRAMLLVLDNAENFILGGSVISELLNRAAQVKMLVTSRVPLHIPGERVLRLSGLPLPTRPEDVEYADASALFLQEAQRAHIGFCLTPEQRPHLMRLCAAVGGFPLALVLAARWAGVLPCSAIADEIECDMDVLSTADTDLPPRHRNVVGVLESALAGLAVDHRALAEALQLACLNHERPGAGALRQLRSLHDRALVTVDPAHGGVQVQPLLARYIVGKHRQELAHSHAA
jgi:DNA-binding SARP family transcriptional activator